MSSILDVVLLFSIIAHVLLLGYLQWNAAPARLRPVWLQFSVLCSLLASVIWLLPETVSLPGAFSRGFLSTFALGWMFVTYGRYALRDALNQRGRLWLLSILWPVGMLVAVFVTEPAFVRVGEPGWLLTVFSGLDLPGLVALAGLAASAILLLILLFYTFYSASLPEIANRALYWVLTTATLTVGVLLYISGVDVLQPLGPLVVLLALTGAAYAHASHRVFDIRGGLVAALRTLVLVVVTAAIILFTLLIADNLRIESGNDYVLALLLLALLAAAFLVITRQFLVLLVRLFWPGDSPTRATRQYSQQVSKAVELSELIQIATDTLNQVMRVRRSGMILVNDTGIDSNRIGIVVMKEAGAGNDLRGHLSRTSPIYEWLAVRRLPLSQYDLAYGARFRDVEIAERQFFGSLRMNAYAPIIVEDAMIGILMCGPRLNDAPLSNADLEMLATMADQTGVALRNSRAVADLKHLNATMQALNRELEEANLQYEKLDSVKTDFITIASHELRTPLAQIRGYVDILDTLNEQGLLDQDQVSGMVDHLRKATERTEDLLAAMLDVSQLDVDAMDLRFAEAAPESIVRMAIEPLTEHIKRRKLTLSARGLRSLPIILCDMQRLVQAIRNIVTNAIKFTPDGGRIDITGSVKKDEAGNDYILMVISDTGVGIDQPDLELIFEKFYRAYDPSLHSTGSYKFMGAGPGLGLTIARGVIESHGGKVWAESSGHNMETYPGTTFYIWLPLIPPEDTRRIAIDDTGDRNPTPVRRPAL
ncbi:MAG: hypothetical protein CL610_03380 [Anaerolineaceae bacterium]|nr:hypothetical protein [Anaerolineaceae bacterium]